MKREIKFRAWSGESMLKDVPSGPVPLGVNAIIQGTTTEVMQYTGLKDKNGKEIYEGDIVVQNSYPWFTDEGKPNYRGVVEWYYSSWNVSAQSVNSDNRGMATGRGLNDDGLDEGATSDWEVIGNIYENPELLKT